MEWMTALRQGIDYMERRLTEDISLQDVAEHVHISPYYFGTGFKMITGFTIGEYLRNRRLYLAALELLSGRCRVIDAAYRYGYETPESFSKAFIRFHGVSPSQITSDKLRPFLPLNIKLTVQGGHHMDYTIEALDAFTVIGVSCRFRFEDSYRQIPKFWDEHFQRCRQGGYSPAVLEVLDRCNVGEFAICIDDNTGDGTFGYMIAGPYSGGPVPEGLELHELPAATWAKFRCLGPLPGALQSVNTEIFQQWLPGNPKYEMAGTYNIEWYSCGNTQSSDYESAIWLPVRERS